MDTTGWLTIKVAYPLPLILSATLIRAIGTVWPEAVIRDAEARVTVLENLLADHGIDIPS